MRKTLLVTACVSFLGLLAWVSLTKERNTGETKSPNEPEVISESDSREQPDSSSGKEGQVSDYSAKATPSLARFVETLNRFAKTANPFSEDVWMVVEPMYAEIESDPQSFTGLLEYFKNSPSTNEGEMIAILLGKAKDPDPRIAEIALELAQSEHQEKKIAGLGLLDRLGLQSKEQLKVVLQILEEESDPKLISEAFFALNMESGIELEEPGLQQRLKKVSVKHATSDHKETRRRAIALLAKVLDDAESFQILVAAFHSKPNSLVLEALEGIAANPDYIDSNLIDEILEFGVKQEDKFSRALVIKALSQVKLDNKQEEKWKALQEIKN